MILNISNIFIGEKSLKYYLHLSIITNELQMDDARPSKAPHKKIVRRINLTSKSIKFKIN